MNIGLWTDYGALNSKKVFEAFANGASKLNYKVYLNKFCDVNVIWSVLWQGRMKNNKKIWQDAKEKNLPVIVLEVGLFNRGYTWKLGLNGVNRDAYFGPKNNDNRRAQQLNLHLEECKNYKKNKKILIACQHSLSGQWPSLEIMNSYLPNTIKEIRTYSDKEIVVRSHPRNYIITDFLKNFKNVSIEKPKKIPGSYDNYNLNVRTYYSVINYSSNPGVEAALAGIPVFTSTSSLAYDVSNKSLSNITKPIIPDRTQWLNDLAYTEWTQDEIKTGHPIKRLTDKI